VKGFSLSNGSICDPLERRRCAGRTGVVEAARFLLPNGVAVGSSETVVAVVTLVGVPIDKLLSIEFWEFLGVSSDDSIATASTDN
jgi:hypothetical protein